MPNAASPVSYSISSAQTQPTVPAHPFGSGVVREVGARWRDRYRVGQRVSVQPAFNLPGRELETTGYAWPTMGGDTTAIRIPAEVLEQGCLLPCEGDGPFFSLSLAEPVSCIVSALRTSYHNAFNSHVHRMGPEPGGTMLLMAGCGAMGLAAVDIACHSRQGSGTVGAGREQDDAPVGRVVDDFAVEVDGVGEAEVFGDGHAGGLPLRHDLPRQGGVVREQP